MPLTRLAYYTLRILKDLFSSVVHLSITAEGIYIHWNIHTSVLEIAIRELIKQKMKVWISSILFVDPPSPLKFGSKNRYQSPETVPRFVFQ